MKKLLIRGGSVVGEQRTTKADVLISVTGEIERIAPSITAPRGIDSIDAKGKLLFPLLIDCHVHFREPGLEHKATMETESQAALAGGIGTVCEMPNTIPPTTTIAALSDKVRRASAIRGCTLKFFFGCTEAAHLQTLQDLWTGSSMELRRLKHHCAGVKIYFDHSTGNQGIPSELIEDVFRVCGELKIPLVAHCEDAILNANAKQACARSDVAAHSIVRPPESEVSAIARAIGLARTYKTPLHIAHLSTAGGASLVRKAKAEKLSVTAEAAPHHLFLTVDDYAELGTLVKVNPPIRTKEDRDALWAALSDGTIDCIATDHAPHTLAEKRSGEPLSVPSGIPGVELSIPLLLTIAAGKWPHPSSSKPASLPQISAQQILRWCFANPNRIFSLHAPLIEASARAKIAIIDPAAPWTVAPAGLKGKCGWTPYEAWQLTGSISQTISFA
jgi:dihydroorotase